MDIAAVVRDFIVENFLFGKTDDLTDEISLLEEGIIDSTGFLELVGFLEEIFSFRVEDDEILPENLDSIRSIVAYVSKKLAYPEVCRKAER